MQYKLLDIRKNKYGMTQEEFAKMIGMPLDTYSKKERGERPFKSDEMFDISEIVGEPIGKIFSKRKHRNGDRVAGSTKMEQEV